MQGMTETEHRALLLDQASDLEWGVVSGALLDRASVLVLSARDTSGQAGRDTADNIQVGVADSPLAAGADSIRAAGADSIQVEEDTEFALDQDMHSVQEEHHHQRNSPRGSTAVSLDYWNYACCWFVLLMKVRRRRHSHCFLFVRIHPRHFLYPRMPPRQPE